MYRLLIKKSVDLTKFVLNIVLIRQVCSFLISQNFLISSKWVNLKLLFLIWASPGFLWSLIILNCVYVFWFGYRN